MACPAVCRRNQQLVLSAQGIDHGPAGCRPGAYCPSASIGPCCDVVDRISNVGSTYIYFWFLLVGESRGSHYTSGFRRYCAI